MSLTESPRRFVLSTIFIGMAAILLARLLFLQLFEGKYKIMSNDITIYRKVVYPPRGIIYDCNGKVLCNNRIAYDLMVVADEVPKDLDTMLLCQIMGILPQDYRSIFNKAKFQNGPKRQGSFYSEVNQEQTARLQENLTAFPGFYLVERNNRYYPEATAGIALGYISEVSQAMMKKDRFSSYQQGDFLGASGLELHYEEVLRGQRGVYFYEKDNFNRPRDSYKHGKLDTTAIAGKSLELYLDAQMQAYGEKLMQNKLGSIVAIDPKTGGIITMVSGPSYDPNRLSGIDRSKQFSALFLDSKKPLFNRAITASYPPGSTQKPLTALIALDVGAITPSFGYNCHGGYYSCGKKVACTHSGGGHAANLRLALANSCNSYFCHVYRLVVDDLIFGSVRKGLTAWYKYMYNFGFGHPTGVDIPYEIGGILYDTLAYDKLYPKGWNSCTNLFLGMGQGEINVTPLQMANAMCIVANHGYYYTPHFVKSINKDTLDPLLKEYRNKHVVTHIPDSSFEIVGLGMRDVVDKGTGTVARIKGIEICAKTGTVENNANINGRIVKMQNHSMFVAFAPRVNPKIAIAVAVENSGYGATWAGPIASLMIEKYLANDSLPSKRKGLENKMMNGHVINKYNSILDSMQRSKDRLRYEKKLEAQKHTPKKDSLIFNYYFKKTGH